MKRISMRVFLSVCFLGIALSSFAGNKDRSGQAGASELLVNPWARSNGVFALNTASVYGVEAMKSNIAGLALDSSTEIGFSSGIYLSGTNISVNNLGIAQSLGDVGVIGLNIMSMSFGDIPVTDYYNPEGYGSFHPDILNIELGFAKRFSTHISAGCAVTYVSEQITNIGATGASFEGGVQYLTGKRDNFHFGVTLRNIGSNMTFTGNGFALNGFSSQTKPNYSVTLAEPSDKFEMPTYLNIGTSYDFYLDDNHVATSESMPKHKLSVILNFQSNSFNNDYYGAGLDYCFMDLFSLRAAYRYEDGIGNPATSTTMFVGFAGGASIQKRIGENGPMIAIDYSYRPTDKPANGIHMFGLRLSR